MFVSVEIFILLTLVFSKEYFGTYEVKGVLLKQ